MEQKWTRREKLRGSAKEKASELLNKIRTVREFAMEISESENVVQRTHTRLKLKLR